jgi:hypothetical protein
MKESTLIELFNKLYFSKSEDDIDKVIIQHSEIFASSNWTPLGQNYSNYGVIENQQSSPIAALIEKITNSIDAILMRKCVEAGIDPKSKEAPHTMEAAIKAFFKDSGSWDLASFRKAQSENLQIVADGPKLTPSLVIYDNGEGQHPEDFEKSFLSLLSGNKNEIHFVQGKYNMGGSGAIVFCGKKSYQLIASKKFDKNGKFGFTLVREHPLTDLEKQTKKNTWYEYLKIEGVIPSFQIDKLDLTLHNRKFETGTLIKLYSYDLPSGSRSVISRDLNQSINEYLFEPALPVLTVDKKERYPDDRNLERPLYGLKRRLEQDENKYVDDYFSEDFRDELFGKNGFARVTCYVFKSKVDGKPVKETKETIRREFFKNNMSVLFSINGQVHGNYTSEFITRSLKMNLLKNHLLIHVDCTQMDIDFRKELFMASRDRLKDGEETRALREFLAKNLGASNGRLAELDKKRKDSLSVEESDTKELLKSFTKNLPLNSDLMKLLSQTFKLEQTDEKKDKKEGQSKQKEKAIKEPFKPQRFPTFFKLRVPESGGVKAINISRGTEKTIRFDTDVENHYFDRIEEPGEIKIALVSYKTNDKSGGTATGKPEAIQDIFNIHNSSPQDGSIRVSLNPKVTVRVGDEIEMKVTLTGAGKDFEEMFWAKITEPEQPKEETKKKEPEESLLGLPEFVLVHKEKKDEKSLSWGEFEEASNEEMKYETVMFPMAEGDTLTKIYINMDSNVLKNFVSKHKNPGEEQMELSRRKYISSVYFHTLFLYTITKNRGYQISKPIEGKSEGEPVDVGTYLKDIFDNYYSSFILNFGGMEEMMSGLAD